jgi:hypothetical protein
MIQQLKNRTTSMGVRESLVPIENAARRRTQYQIVKELCRRLGFLTPRPLSISIDSA